MQKGAFPFLLLFFLLSIGVVFISQKQQDLRTRASADTTLSLLPSASMNHPIVKRVGDTVALDVFLNPGTNHLTTVKMHIVYDSSVFVVSEKDGFVSNKKALPFAVEGPIINNNDGSVIATFFVGVDPKLAIKVPTKIGTLTLKAMRETYNLSSSKIYFEETSQAYSVSSQDFAYENVIATTIPTYVLVRPKDTAGSVSTVPAKVSDSPALEFPVVFTTGEVTPSPSNITPSPSPVPTKPPTEVKVSFTIKLPGIGKNKLDNNRPKRTTRYAKIFLVNSQTFISTIHDVSLQYDENSGVFSGKLTVPDFKTGIYKIQLKADGYEQTELSPDRLLTAGSEHTLSPVTLVGGDVDNNGSINIVDYNFMFVCSLTGIDPNECGKQVRLLADLDDTGNVDENDQFIFIQQNE